MHRIVFSVLLLPLAKDVLAADCNNDQPIQDNGPTPDDIAAYYYNAIDLQKSGTCQGGFPPNNPLSNTFNANQIFFTVTRDKADGPLDHCHDAFSNIIEQCVKQEKKWGGQWSLDGQHYTIKNNAYPQNGIVLPGGQSSSTSSTPPAASSSSSAPANGNGGPIVIPGGNGQGPITIPPQTSTETGDFSTSYISGVTANTVTTTRLSNSPGTTILPVWFCKLCIAAAAGILVIPAAAPAAGGLIPPPPGFPALAIGPNGQPTPTGDPAPGNEPTGDPRQSQGNNPSPSAGGSPTAGDAESTISEPTPTGDCPYWGSTPNKRSLSQARRDRVKKVHEIHILSKRAEAEMTVQRPLISALQAIGGKDKVVDATSLEIVTNRFPEPLRDRFVTGLQGKVSTNININYNGNIVKMKTGDLFRIRWDFDPTKGTHVNAEFFGSTTQGATKIAFFPANKPIVDGPGQRNNMLFQQVIDDQSNALNYQTKPNPEGGRYTPLQRTVGTTPEGQAKELQAMAQQLAQRWAAQTENC